MVYTYKDLIDKYGSNYQIQKAVKEKKLYKIESGIYSDKENNHYLDIFTHKYPNAIISGDSVTKMGSRTTYLLLGTGISYVELRQRLHKIFI